MEQLKHNVQHLDTLSKGNISVASLIVRLYFLDSMSQQRILRHFGFL